MGNEPDLEYLETVVESQEYLAAAARAELDRLRKNPGRNALDVLRSSALIHAHASMHDQAIAQLNAAASETRGSDPAVLNKLAQVQLRRRKEGDLAGAVAAANRVLELPDTSDTDRWFAHHNLAIGSWASGDTLLALDHAKKALEFLDDPRTRAMIDALAGNESDDFRRYLPDATIARPPDQQVWDPSVIITTQEPMRY